MSIIPFSCFVLAGLVWAAQSPSPRPSGTGDGAPQETTATSPAPESLLEQSYRMGRYFSSEERCFHLFRLADAAAHLHSKAGGTLAERWSEELFRRSLKLPEDWNRVAFEKNALVTLAAVDPVKAFEWFPRMEAPVFSGGQIPPEDLRAFGARTIFIRLWEVKGAGAIDPIRMQARNIGRTGEYPYAAMIPILEQLTRRQEMERFESIFMEALSFYAEGTRVRTANNEFIQFLNANWPYLSSSLRRQVLSAAVSNLTKKEASDKARVYVGRVVTNEGTASFSNANLQLLRQILPKVREVDPHWAERLEEDIPELTQAAGVAKYSSGMTILNPDGVSADKAGALGTRSLQGAILTQVQGTASGDPEGASGLMNSLTDPEFRSEGFSSLASGFSLKDPARAKTLLADAQKSEKEIKNPVARLAALVALTKAAASLHDYALMGKWMNEAFDLGEEVLNEDLDLHPGKAVYMAEGVEELGALTSLGVQTAFRDTMARLGHLKNETLQAYLLIAGAEGLQKLKSTPVAQQDQTPQSQ